MEIKEVGHMKQAGIEASVNVIGNPWHSDNFAHAFGFQREGTTIFSKEIGGQKYTFEPVEDATGLEEVMHVQQAAWGWGDKELAPIHILILMKATGGGVFGAYDEEGKMVGFAAGFGGGEDPITGERMIVSSMNAVATPNQRGSGIGEALKLVQAYDGYQHGYTSMAWFYDPERGANASLNVGTLGARIEDYAVNKYGSMESELYGSVPTDRAHAIWRFTHPAVVERLLSGQKPTLHDVSGEEFAVITKDVLPVGDKVLLPISPDIDSEQEAAKISRRFASRVQWEYYLGQGYIGTEFVTGHVHPSTGEIGNGSKAELEAAGFARKSYYLLERLPKGGQYGSLRRG